MFAVDRCFPEGGPGVLPIAASWIPVARYFSGIPADDAGGLNANYEALLPVHRATCFGDMFFDVTKVIS